MSRRRASTRDTGTNPRAKGTNPRAKGTNPSAGSTNDQRRLATMRDQLLTDLHRLGLYWCDDCEDTGWLPGGFRCDEGGEHLRVTAPDVERWHGKGYPERFRAHGKWIEYDPWTRERLQSDISKDFRHLSTKMA